MEAATPYFQGVEDSQKFVVFILVLALTLVPKKTFLWKNEWKYGVSKTTPVENLGIPFGELK